MKPRSLNFAGIRSTTDYPSGVSVVDRPFSFSDKFSVSTDVRNGNFHSPNAQEFDKEFTCSFSGTRLRFDPVAFGGALSQSVTGTTGIVPAYFIPLSTVSNNTYNAALSRLYDKIRGGIDLSVDLAESGQVVGMVRGVGKTISYVTSFKPSDLAHWYRDFRRDPSKAIKNHAKGTGSKWLEFQYGWKPFAQSVYDTSLALQNSVSKPIRVKARASDSTVGLYSDRLDFDSFKTYTAKVTRSERCEIAVRIAPKPSALLFLSGFTSLNPVSIAWELTPYSFVVDWFLNVGGYLRSLESALLYASSFVDGYRTDGIRLVSECDKCQGTAVGSGYTWLYDYSSGLAVSSRKTRSVLSTIPYPHPPQLQADLGSTQLLNAAGLLSQHL